MGFIFDRKATELKKAKKLDWNKVGPQNTVFLNDVYQVGKQKVIISGGLNLTEEIPSDDFQVDFKGTDTVLAADWVGLDFSGAIFLLFDPPVIAVGTNVAVVGDHDPIPFEGLIGAHWEDGKTLNTKVPGATSAGGKAIFLGVSGRPNNRIQWIAIDAEEHHVPISRIAINQLSLVVSG
jgi:hypothetical protein